ncbi:MAG: hypothetical protein AAFO84_02660 [Cyanobacteria bacterium J06598_1]
MELKKELKKRTQKGVVYVGWAYVYWLIYDEVSELGYDERSIFMRSQ